MADYYPDCILEFCIEHDKPTGDLYLAALKQMPHLACKIEEWFKDWLWMDWVEANVPYEETEADIAERGVWVEKAMMRFWEKMAEMKGTLSGPGEC